MKDKDLGFVLIELEYFINNPDNEFITDKERNAFYIIAECINKFIIAKEKINFKSHEGSIGLRLFKKNEK